MLDFLKIIWYNGFGARTPFVKIFTKFELGTTNSSKSSHLIITCLLIIVNSKKK